jgi:general secretion pathway protein C
LNLTDVIQRWNAPPPDQLVARASERLPFWVSLLLVIAIGYYLAQLVWLLVPAGEPAQWTPPPMAGGASDGNAVGADYASVINAHLFGVAKLDGASEAPDADADAASAPETALNLTLRGAIAAEDPRYAHAIIADGSGTEKVYFVKDAVPGGAMLHMVQADRVILNRGGVLESLLLPRELASGARSARGSDPPRRSVAAPQTARSVQEVIDQNPTVLTEIIRPQPFMPNGQLKGYRVYPGRNREQFIQLGLQPGDLITEINGMALNNPAQAMEIFRSMADTTEVSVTIEREGQPQSLNLDTSQLAEAADGETE